MIPKLPRDTFYEDTSGPNCPWCGADVDEATVTLSSLAFAHMQGQLEHPERSAEGLADHCALTSDCPHCARPFAIVLCWRRGDPTIRLLAVRTEADVRLLSGEGRGPA